MRKLFILLICPLLLACACDDDDKDCEDIDDAAMRLTCLERRDGGTQPTPIPIPVARTYTVEYRVIGLSPRAHVIYASSIHGTNEIITNLPWFFSFKTNKDRIFVSLYAKAEDNGNVRVQIFVDGELYKESSTDGFFGTSTEVSGTFFHPDTVTISKQK